MIKQINFVERIDELRGLMVQNWAETGYDFEFDLDLDVYSKMIDAGILFTVAAFDKDVIVGYCMALVINHPQSKNTIVASSDTIFIHPNYRNSFMSGKIIKVAQEEAKSRGAVRFIWHCRFGTEIYDTFLNHGYKPIDSIVMRGL